VGRGRGRNPVAIHRRVIAVKTLLSILQLELGDPERSNVLLNRGRAAYDAKQYLGGGVVALAASTSASG